MTSNDSKIEKIQAHFKALSSTASSLNTASDELARAVAVLDEALKKLNVGLTAWATFRTRDDDDFGLYDKDQIGYCKLNGKWGIALRRIWGNVDFDDHREDGPWLFNDAPRELRLNAVDGIPDLIEALGKEAFDTAKRVQEKTQQVRELAGVIENLASKQDGVKGRE